MFIYCIIPEWLWKATDKDTKILKSIIDMWLPLFSLHCRNYNLNCLSKANTWMVKLSLPLFNTVKETTGIWARGDRIKRDVNSTSWKFRRVYHMEPRKDSSKREYLKCTKERTDFGSFRSDRLTDSQSDQLSMFYVLPNLFGFSVCFYC